MAHSKKSAKELALKKLSQAKLKLQQQAASASPEAISLGRDDDFHWSDLKWTPALSRIVDLELHLEEYLAECLQNQEQR